MKTVSLAAALALALIALPASAEQMHAHHAPAVEATTDAALKEPIAVVERFSAALKAGDFDTVRTLLDEKVVILESGGAERSREEYLGHHAISDAAFLGGATVSDVKRGGAVRGDLAWVASESRIQSGQGGDAKTLLSTETMVLERGADGWRIVHIHWSSRPKR